MTDSLGARRSLEDKELELRSYSIRSSLRSIDRELQQNMDYENSPDDSVGFFMEDGSTDMFSRSMTTPVTEIKSIEEKDQLKILNELFGSPGLAAFGDFDFNEANVDKSKCDSGRYQSKPSKLGDQSWHDKGKSVESSGELVRQQARMPTFARRKSNPFYSPSRQIVELVSKRRKSKTPTLVKSHSSAAVLTMSQIDDKRKSNKRSDAGPSRTAIK